MKNFAEISALINQAIEDIKWKKEPMGLYEPIAYTMLQTGKRIRPALMLMAYNLYKEDVEKVIKPALAVEVFHNFTLLHDDIMDNAAIRRGEPTVHKKWDANTAILSGDVMQIMAYHLLAETPQEYLKDVLDVFNQTAAEICEGQQYDMEFENLDDVNTDDYINMIRLKTAVLLGASMQIGAIIAGASKADQEFLYDFGVNIGLGFQLKDDLLDVYGDIAQFGKEIGGDIVSNKKTYLLIEAKRCAKGKKREDLTYWLHAKDKNPAQKIKKITEIYNYLGIKNLCEDAMKFYYKMAIASLEKVEVETIKMQELRKLAEELMHRTE